jgi:hypothetical protein
MGVLAPQHVDSGHQRQIPTRLDLHIRINIDVVARRLNIRLGEVVVLGEQRIIVPSVPVP